MFLSLSLRPHDFVPYHRPILAKRCYVTQTHSFCCIYKWGKESEFSDEKKNARKTPNILCGRDWVNKNFEEYAQLHIIL